jgi:hypothetical protein
MKVRPARQKRVYKDKKELNSAWVLTKLQFILDYSVRTLCSSAWHEEREESLYSCSVVMVLVISCQKVLEDLWTIWSCCLYVFYEYYCHIPSYSLSSIFLSIYTVLFLFYNVIYVFYCYDYVFSLYVYVWLSWLRFFRAFFSVVRQMPG